MFRNYCTWYLIPLSTSTIDSQIKDKKRFPFPIHIRYRPENKHAKRNEGNRTPSGRDRDRDALRQRSLNK